MWIVSSFPFYFHALFYVKVTAVRRKADLSYRKHQENRRKRFTFNSPKKPTILGTVNSGIYIYSILKGYLLWTPSYLVDLSNNFNVFQSIIDIYNFSESHTQGYKIVAFKMTGVSSTKTESLGKTLYKCLLLTLNKQCL